MNGVRSTHTLPGADIRGYYQALGVKLPDWAQHEATVSCFADPEAHRRGDQHPSCSVNLEHGAWRCHGCGARGGAFDAATKLGHTERGAIDLMIRYGITSRRPGPRHERRPNARQSPTMSGTSIARRNTMPKLIVTEADIGQWQTALTTQTMLIGRLTRERGWLYSTMLELNLGYDHGRITIPVRDDRGRLVGLLRYRPFPEPGQPKMLASRGSRRALLPHPAAEPSRKLLLVEGEPDMIAARSRGIPAIALPGAESWRAEWATLLAGREVTIVMDCDRDGRRAAARIAQDLCGHADVAEFDIAPERNDGYDLTDLFRDHPRLAKEILL
jgi:DNA primase